MALGGSVGDYLLIVSTPSPLNFVWEVLEVYVCFLHNRSCDRTRQMTSTKEGILVGKK